MSVQPALFETHAIRRVYDEETETWWFSVVDIVQVLTQQPDYQTARKYWNKLKERLGKEGSQLVTNCHRLKMPAADGKQRPHRCRHRRNPAASGAVRTQPEGRADQAVAGEGGLRADAGNGRPGAVAGPRPRDLAEARAQREVDPAAHDRAGDAQQADRLLGEPRHQEGRGIRDPHQIIHQEWVGREREGAQGDEGLARPKPARPHERGGTDFHRAGRACRRARSPRPTTPPAWPKTEAATKGGAIAKKARKALEAKTGKSVVTGDNFLPLNQTAAPKGLKAAGKKKS